MSYLVEIWVKTKSTKGSLHSNNAAIGVGVIESVDSSAFSRMMKNRGFFHLANRNSDEMEYEECGGKYRIGYMTYNNWDKLIADEKKFNCCDDAWVNKLQVFKSQYPQFNVTQTRIEL